MTYTHFDGHLVSIPWSVALAAARHAGVAFELNSGHRTIAEQEQLVAEKGVWSPSNPHGAAEPDAEAPHIRIGRIDHALDIDALDGGANRLAAWLRAHGADAAFTVPGEPWHIEVPASDLRRLQGRFADPLAHYTAPERRWIREYDSRPSLRRRRVLRAYMKRQRKAIWHAAQQTGWHRLNRQARYRSLLVRTK